MGGPHCWGGIVPTVGVGGGGVGGSPQWGLGGPPQLGWGWGSPQLGVGGGRGVPTVGSGG